VTCEPRGSARPQVLGVQAFGVDKADEAELQWHELAELAGDL
jgi:hypothetical protein